MKKIFEYIAVLIWLYLVIIIPFIVSIYFLQLIAGNWILINRLIKQIPDPATLLALVLFFPGLGIVLLTLNGKIKPVLIWKIGWNLLLVDLTISVALAYSFWRFFPVLFNTGIVGLLILSLFLLIYLPQIALFFDSIDLLDFKIFFTVNRKNLYRYFTKILIIGIFSAVLIFVFNKFVVFSNKKIVAYKEKYAYQSVLPFIKKSEPYLVYRSTNIVLYGSNFGLEGGKIADNVFTNSVHNQYEEVHFTFWDNNKIIFQVPLHWKYGDINVWIVREITWKGKRIKIKSNIVKFKLLETTGSWDKNDDAYFEQLKHLDKETLRINGYNSK